MKSKRGGKREGAGRPTISEDGETRVMFITTTVANSTNAAFRAAADEAGKSVGELLDTIAKNLRRGKK